MLKITDLRHQIFSPADVLPRAALDVSAAVEQIEPIVHQVRDGGVNALLELAERFDGVRPESLRVPQSVLDQALDGLDPQLREALVEAIRRARDVHAAQLPQDSTVELGAGAEVVNRWVPVNRVGLYVPGGQAVYPSSVVMNVVPAQAAGVASLAIASPPQKEHGGWPHPTILAAAKLLGVDEVYAVGGAQAVAMFAYGAGLKRHDAGADVEQSEAQQLMQCPPADMVTGPGNIYVAAAKRALRGVIGIDAEAGPTEIAVLADETANPVFVAADLISQAEHDPMAASVLVTDSMDLAQQVAQEVSHQVEQAQFRERITAALSGDQSAILVVDDLATAVKVVDEYAAEHLQVMTAQARTVAEQITNAGAIFVGDYSPVPLGDYCAGSNHVLPTSGTAKFSSGLNVTSFLRSQQIIHYAQPALASVAHHIQALAHDEGLPAHGAAIGYRLSGH